MADRPSPTAGLAAFLLAVLGLTAFTFLYLALGHLGVRLGNYEFLYDIALQVIVFGMPVLLYYRHEVDMRPAMRLRRVDPLSVLLIILAAFAGMLALNWISIYWTVFLDSIGLVTSTGTETVPRTLPQLWLALITSALIPAIFEELLFRGLLLPSLEPLGKRRAILISGCFFALLHGSVEALPAHLPLGFMLAWLVLGSGSLCSAIIYHAAYNAVILVAAYISRSADSASAASLPTAGQCLDTIPIVALLLAAWLLLLRAGARRQKRSDPGDPLLPADRKPLTRRGKQLLAVSCVLLVLYELLAFVLMLPGVGI